MERNKQKPTETDYKGKKRKRHSKTYRNPRKQTETNKSGQGQTKEDH